MVSIKAPPLRPRLIDRFLIATQRGGAQPAICVNKIDLAENRELPELQPYEQLGIPIVVCSTRTAEGIDALRTLIEGKTCALVGHSGVGKSSILNALDARLQLATADVHKKRGTGRHTTSASTLFDLGNETYVIDTPGIREFGLWDITPESLRETKPPAPGEHPRGSRHRHPLPRRGAGAHGLFAEVQQHPRDVDLHRADLIARATEARGIRQRARL